MAVSKQQKSKTNIRRPSLAWVAVMSIFVLELLFYTWCRVQCTHTGYLITEQKDKNKERMAIQNSLNTELARLKAPNNISRVARQQLGMSMPEPQQIILVP